MALAEALSTEGAGVEHLDLSMILIKQEWVDHNTIGELGGAAIGRVLAGNKCLISLTLEGYNAIHLREIRNQLTSKELWEGVAKSTTLQYLCMSIVGTVQLIDLNKLRRGHGEAIANAIRGCGSLRKLEIAKYIVFAEKVETNWCSPTHSLSSMRSRFSRDNSRST